MVKNSSVNGEINYHIVEFQPMNRDMLNLNTVPRYQMNNLNFGVAKFHKTWVN